MTFRRATLTAAALLTLTLPTAPATAATQLSGSVEIRCATDTLRQDADWYLPDGEPRATVWIQHGFARTNAQISALATRFTDAGYLVFAPSLPFVQWRGCTLQNLGDNSGFLHNVADLFGAATDPDAALSRSLTEAASARGVAVPRLPADLVFVGHSAGAEAVTFVADRIRSTHPATFTGLRGVILLDPVRSFVGDNISRALTGLDPTGLPVLTISAAPALCNSFGIGTLAVQAGLHRPFVGVRLRDGVHTDAEGASSDILGTALCGTPTAADAEFLGALALGWTDDFLSGAPESTEPRARALAATGPAVDLLSGK